jgi:hypothetical protein
MNGGRFTVGTDGVAEPPQQRPAEGPLVGEVFGGPAPVAAKDSSKEPASARTTAAGVLLLPIVVALLVGLVMVICTGDKAGPGHSGIGLGLLVFGIPLFVVTVFVLVFQPAPGDLVRAGVLGGVALLILLMSLTAGLAGLAGQAVRWVDPADYTGRFGTRVTAKMPAKCENDVHVSVGGLKGADADVVCDHATWQLDGRQHEGTVVIGWDDINLPVGIAVPDKAEAYVIGDKGYSVARVGRVENVGWWGGAPLWWLVGLPIAVVALLLLKLSGWVAKGEAQSRSAA